MGFQTSEACLAILCRPTDSFDHTERGALVIHGVVISGTPQNPYVHVRYLFISDPEMGIIFLHKGLRKKN